MSDSSKTPFLGQKGQTDNCKYYKRKLLGTGSYGEAWLAERASDGAIYVAKKMDLTKMSDRDKDYAVSEIKCLASCDHPNIIKYVEDHEDDGQLIIVMEFADAGDVDRQIKGRAADNMRYFQEHEVLFLFLQMCLCLDHIHRRKMLHRDIKGANVLLTGSGLVKLGDFGFSHQYEQTVSAGVASTFCGTPYYLAPEIWAGQRYSKKADVWSLGVLLYEMLALKRPFLATNMKGLMAKVQAGEFPPLPEKYSPEMTSLVKTLLAVNTNQRPSLAQVFAIPFIRNSMPKLIESIDRSAKISDEVKAAFHHHIEISLSSSAGSVIEMAPCIEAAKKDITHRGVVRKFGGSKSKDWKDRWLVLTKGHLILCDNEADEANGKAMNIQQLHSVVPVAPSTSHMDFVFALNTQGGRSMWLQALNQQEMEAWIDVIHRALGIA